MDYDSVEDLATGKWCGYWGGLPNPTKRQRSIVRVARQLETMITAYLKEIDKEVTK